MPDHPDPRVALIGPASWNHLISLDRLPEPRPHMQVARRAFHTVGGTSAGKALHLAALGVDTALHTLLADDDAGRLIERCLQGAGVAVSAHPSRCTERHVNLMTDSGERVSLYVSTPDAPSQSVVDAAARAAQSATVTVVDLGEFGARALGRLDGARIWTDLHDYDGVSAFHELFLRSAEVVFMNADAVEDPWRLLEHCVQRGPRLAVCTLGAAGAIALRADGERASVPAVPTGVVDSNGAGDAFFAGVLAACLGGACLPDALAAGARQAAVALGSAHLHPVLDGMLPAAPAAVPAGGPR